MSGLTPPWIYYGRNRDDVRMAKTHSQALQSTHQQDLFPDFPAKFTPKGSFRLITKSRETGPASCPARRCQRGFGVWGVSVHLSLLALSFLLTLHLLLSPAPRGEELPAFQEPGGKHPHRVAWAQALPEPAVPVATTILGEEPTPPRCQIPTCEDLVLPWRTWVDLIN